MKKNIFFLSVLFFFASCEENFVPATYSLEVTDAAITPLGEIDTEQSFHLELENDTATCTFILRNALKTDTLRSITASVRGQELSLSVITSLSEYWRTYEGWVVLGEKDGHLVVGKDEWAHTIRFRLAGIKNKFYTVDLWISDYLWEKKVINMDLQHTNSFTAHL